MVTKKKTTKKSANDRVNLKLPADLKKWMFKYAEKHGTTVTQMIIDHFVRVRNTESKKLSGDAEQV